MSTTCASSSASPARTGSSRSFRTAVSIRCGSTPKPTAAPRRSTLTMAWSITQTGMPPHRRRRRSDSATCRGGAAAPETLPLRFAQGQRRLQGREGVMSELVDDQSHYEVSLTAGQAFLAFVLLLLSLAASFAFGLLIGRGQIDDRLTARKEPAVVNEASVLPRKAVAREVPVAKDEDFKEATIKEESGGQAPPPVQPPVVAAPNQT